MNELLVWNNMRLLSVDGTRLVLLNHKSVKEEFGEHSIGPNADSKRSLAMGSFLYDPINMLTLDAQIAPYASSERELLYKHLKKVEKGLKRQQKIKSTNALSMTREICIVLFLKRLIKHALKVII